MKGKQTIIDIVVVVLVPLAIVSGYYFWKQSDSTSLLSLIAPSLMARPCEEVNDVGAKVTVALATLNTIKLDNSIFTDPVYNSLRDFSVIIATTTIGRDYPFSLPQSIIDKERNRQTNDAAYRASVNASSKVNVNISTKIDGLKIGT